MHLMQQMDGVLTQPLRLNIFGQSEFLVFDAAFSWISAGYYTLWTRFEYLPCEDEYRQASIKIVEFHECLLVR